MIIECDPGDQIKSKRVCNKIFGDQHLQGNFTRLLRRLNTLRVRRINYVKVQVFKSKESCSMPDGKPKQDAQGLALGCNASNAQQSVVQVSIILADFGVNLFFGGESIGRLSFAPESFLVPPQLNHEYFLIGGKWVLKNEAPQVYRNVQPKSHISEQQASKPSNTRLIISTIYPLAVSFLAMIIILTVVVCVICRRCSNMPNNMDGNIYE